jgi:hypothetical protein
LLTESINLILYLIFYSIFFVHLDLGCFEFDVEGVELLLERIGLFNLFGACLNLKFFEVVVHLLDIFIGLFDVLLKSFKGLLNFGLSFA